MLLLDIIACVTFNSVLVLYVEVVVGYKRYNVIEEFQ